MNDDLIEYLQRLQACHYSASRITQMRYAVELLISYVREQHQVSDWREVTAEHIYQFAGWLGTRYRKSYGGTENSLVSLSTIRQWLSCVRVFLHWQVTEQRLMQNPIAQMRLPRPQSTQVRALSEAEMSRLIETPDISKKLGIRDRAILELLYATGLRLREVCRLDLYDVELTDEQITVRGGKGGSDRVLPLTEQACHWLQRYISEVRGELALGQLPTKRRRQALMKPPPTLSPALWLTVYGRRLAWQTLLQLIRQYGAEIKVKATVHTFRHSFATHLLKRGAAIEDIKRLLGHRNLDITQIYTHLETADLQQVIKKAALPHDKEPLD